MLFFFELLDRLTANNLFLFMDCFSLPHMNLDKYVMSFLQNHYRYFLKKQKTISVMKSLYWVFLHWVAGKAKVFFMYLLSKKLQQKYIGGYNRHRYSSKSTIILKKKKHDYKRNFPSNCMVSNSNTRLAFVLVSWRKSSWPVAVGISSVAPPPVCLLISCDFSTITILYHMVCCSAITEMWIKMMNISTNRK